MKIEAEKSDVGQKIACLYNYATRNGVVKLQANESIQYKAMIEKSSLGLFSLWCATDLTVSQFIQDNFPKLAVHHRSLHHGIV